MHAEFNSWQEWHLPSSLHLITQAGICKLACMTMHDAKQLRLCDALQHAWPADAAVAAAAVAAFPAEAALADAAAAELVPDMISNTYVTHCYRGEHSIKYI